MVATEPKVKDILQEENNRVKKHKEERKKNPPLLTDIDREIILKKLDNVGEKGKELISEITTEPIWDEKNKRWINPPNWNIADSFMLQCRRGKEDKENNPTVPSGTEGFMIEEEDKKVLDSFYAKYGLVAKLRNADEEFESMDMGLNAVKNVSLYKEIMDKHQEEIFAIQKLIFNSNKKEMSIERTVGFIEKRFKIRTVRSKNKKDMWIELDGFLTPDAESYIKELTRIIWMDKYVIHIYQSVIIKIEADTMVDAEEFFKEKEINLIPLENGVYDISTKEFYTYKDSPKKVAFFSKIPTKYVNTAKCENFMKHLEDCLPDERDIMQMQEIFGYCLLRDYPIHKAFLWLGVGRNGKGVVARALAKMLGQLKNVASISLSSIEGYPFSVAQLHTKHANIIGELEQKKIESTENFKKLTGGDLIEAPRKNKSYVPFVNYAKFVILGNELFPTRDMTPAFFERLSLIQFPYQFVQEYDYKQLTEEEIVNGNYKLGDMSIYERTGTEEEIQGILLWAIEGLHRLLDKKQFTVSKTTEEVKQLYLRKSNNMSAFIEEFVEYKWGEYISKKEFRYMYSLFCRKYQVHPMNNKIINETLKDFGAVDGQRNNRQTNNINTQVWDGIGFSPIPYKKLLEWAKENGYDEPIQEKMEGLFVEGVDALDNAVEVRRT